MRTTHTFRGFVLSCGFLSLFVLTLVAMPLGGVSAAQPTRADRDASADASAFVGVWVLDREPFVEAEVERARESVERARETMREMRRERPELYEKMRERMDERGSIEERERETVERAREEASRYEMLLTLRSDGSARIEKSQVLSPGGSRGHGGDGNAGGDNSSDGQLVTTHDEGEWVLVDGRVLFYIEHRDRDGRPEEPDDQPSGDEGNGRDGRGERDPEALAETVERMKSGSMSPIAAVLERDGVRLRGERGMLASSPGIEAFVFRRGEGLGDKKYRRRRVLSATENEPALAGTAWRVDTDSMASRMRSRFGSAFEAAREKARTLNRESGDAPANGEAGDGGSPNGRKQSGARTGASASKANRSERAVSAAGSSYDKLAETSIELELSPSGWFSMTATREVERENADGEAGDSEDADRRTGAEPTRLERTLSGRWRAWEDRVVLIATNSSAPGGDERAPDYDAFGLSTEALGAGVGAVGVLAWDADGMRWVSGAVPFVGGGWDEGDLLTRVEPAGEDG